ncbi:MAG TPA: hypothetical protein VFC56_17520 [Stellaceae bacterium]|nr:hypothetical protein [Stellaceae bacterium]
MTAAIIDTLPKKGLLLPARGKDKPMSGFSKLKPALDKKAGVKDYTLHDLRRTVASTWQALGIPIAVTEKYLAHAETTGGIVGVYQRHTFMPEMRAALEKWEAHLASLLSAS